MIPSPVFCASRKRRFVVGQCPFGSALFHRSFPVGAFMQRLITKIMNQRFITAGLLLLTGAMTSFGQLSSTDSSFSVVDRGASYRVWQSSALVTNYLTGQVAPEIHS